MLCSAFWRPPARSSIVRPESESIVVLRATASQFSVVFTVAGSRPTGTWSASATLRKWFAARLMVMGSSESTGPAAAGAIVVVVVLVGADFVLVFLALGSTGSGLTASPLCDPHRLASVASASSALYAICLEVSGGGLKRIDFAT